MFKRTNWKFYASHPSHLLCPKTCSIHNVLTLNVTFCSPNNPTIWCLIKTVNFNIFIIFSTPLSSRSGIRLYCPCSVDVAFSICPHCTQDTIHRHNWTTFLSFLGSKEFTVANSYRLKNTIIRLKPLPPFRSACQSQTPSHMKANVLTRLFFNLWQKIYGIGLQSSHVWVGVQSMNSTGSMPTRSRSKPAPFEHNYIFPAHFGKMV